MKPQLDLIAKALDAKVILGTVVVPGIPFHITGHGTDFQVSSENDGYPVFKTVLDGNQLKALLPGLRVLSREALRLNTEFTTAVSRLDAQVEAVGRQPDVVKVLTALGGQRLRFFTQPYEEGMRFAS